MFRNAPDAPGLFRPPPSLPGPSAPGRLSSNLDDLLRGGGIAAQLASVRDERGEVEVRVRFDNTPPGTRAEVESRGSLIGGARIDVGYRQGFGTA